MNKAGNLFVDSDSIHSILYRTLCSLLDCVSTFGGIVFDSSLIQLSGVSKIFRTEMRNFAALQDIDLEILAGEFVAIVGRSGSGKSTLLNILTGIDSPTKGEVKVNGASIHSMKQDEIAKWRGKNVGIVFQFFQLLPTLTIIENVMLPMDFSNSFVGRRNQRAYDLLEQCGISDHANKLPAALSGGEQQRAAIARAIANDPPIVVADEPTGNLDSKTAGSILELFQQLSAAGKTIVIVTHEREIEQAATRIFHLEDGRLLNGALSHANPLE
jgi:putative ABC transport system ATP-binding protein